MRLFGVPEPLVTFSHPYETGWASLVFVDRSDEEIERQERVNEARRLESLRVSYSVENKGDTAIRNVTTGLRTPDRRVEHCFDQWVVQVLEDRGTAPVEQVLVPADLHQGMTDSDRALNFDYWVRFTAVDGRWWEATYNPLTRVVTYEQLSGSRFRRPTHTEAGLMIGALSLILTAVGLVATFVLGVDGRADASGQSITSSAECHITGQVFDPEGAPLPAAAIVARSPEAPWEGFSYRAPESLATTNAEGRYEGDCSAAPKPFLAVVNWELGQGSDERCEWWRGPVISEDGNHVENIEVPWEEMEAGPYRYPDDGTCSLYADQ